MVTIEFHGYGIEMKNNHRWITPLNLPLIRALKAGSFALLCLLALPEKADAKGPRASSYSSKHKKSSHHDQSDSERYRYSSHPNSSFILSYGNGYAGRGYYYGPPNSGYYHQRSDVRYYPNRESASRSHYSQERDGHHQSDSSVQRELARRGYYRGYVDGRMGPQSRRAIYRYQQDRGMRPTGYVTTVLLQSLGLR